mmetsp:Transcript_10255/g.33848  ORF Transcript_10255/g.33848 Transcript_10255/m.33848 type:complete len:358 (+) Transcript_10255:3565-4638(+)|eukprot:scaffold544_cov117-Isochrysis_galbana.AAC.22
MCSAFGLDLGTPIVLASRTRHHPTCLTPGVACSREGGSSTRCDTREEPPACGWLHGCGREQRKFSACTHGALAFECAHQLPHRAEGSARHPRCPPARDQRTQTINGSSTLTKADDAHSRDRRHGGWEMAGAVGSRNLDEELSPRGPRLDGVYSLQCDWEVVWEWAQRTEPVFVCWRREAWRGRGAGACKPRSRGGGAAAALHEDGRGLVRALLGLMTLSEQRHKANVARRGAQPAQLRRLVSAAQSRAAGVDDEGPTNGEKHRLMVRTRELAGAHALRLQLQVWAAADLLHSVTSAIRAGSRELPLASVVLHVRLEKTAAARIIPCVRARLARAENLPVPISAMLPEGEQERRVIAE